MEWVPAWLVLCRTGLLATMATPLANASNTQTGCHPRCRALGLGAWPAFLVASFSAHLMQSKCKSAPIPCCRSKIKLCGMLRFATHVSFLSRAQNEKIRTVEAMRMLGFQGLFSGFGATMIWSVPSQGIFYLAFDCATKVRLRLRIRERPCCADS